MANSSSRVPTVSVVVRIHNGESFVASTLAKILGQTRPPDEVIVIDDGSTDASREVVSGFGGSVRLICQQNAGHSAALNRGFHEARSSYVANCDADDLWEPTKLERQFDVLRARPEIDVAFTGTASFGLRNHTWHGVPGDGVLAHEPFLMAMCRRNLICTSSTVVRRALLKSIGEFSTQFLTCEDYEFWMRALRARSIFHFDPEILVRHREHGAAATSDTLRILSDTRRVHLLHRDLVRYPSLARSIAADDLNRIGRALVEDGDLPAARAAFVASLGQRRTAFALAWIATLSVPATWRRSAIRTTLVAVRQARRHLPGADPGQSPP